MRRFDWIAVLPFWLIPGAGVVLLALSAPVVLLKIAVAIGIWLSLCWLVLAVFRGGDL